MRTEGDTWDIVSSVGATALGVAAFRAIETARPDAMISDEYAQLFVHAAGDPQFIDILDDPQTVRALPRMMGLRTKFFDEFFQAAAADGTRQAVIVAAGLDARTYRLDWPAGTKVFEIDQPKVLEFKQGVLADSQVVARAELRNVAVDLRDDWPAALSAAGFDPNQPTAWSAEGLLPYLPGAAQDALFERIDTLSAPGSRFAVESTQFDSGDVERIQEAEKAMFDRNPFGTLNVAELFYGDERADPIQWLRDHGWSVDGSSVDDLATRYQQQTLELPDGINQLASAQGYIAARK